MFELFKKKSEQYQFHALERQASELKHTIAVLEEKRISLQDKIDGIERAIDDEEETLNTLTGRNHAIEQMEEYGIPYYDCGLDELTTKRYELQDKVMKATNDGLWKVMTAYTLNGSASKGKTMQKTYGDGLIYAFTEYFSKKEKAITQANIQHTKEMIKNKFNNYQKKATNLGIALNSDYAKARLDMLDVNLAIKVKEKEEKARIREEKKRLREQEQLLADIAKERAKLEEERKAMDIAFDAALTDAEREDIKSKMADIDKRIDDIDYRESHMQAGWLYVISSPSLPGLCKIGCTRRLNPSIRVRELSSSSLPEPFKAHCFVFSDNCFELENNMHKYFDTERVSPNREFFRINPKDAIKALREEFHVDVHFEDTDDAEDDE